MDTDKLQEMMDNAGDASRMKTLALSPQLTLGDIITKLEHLQAGLDKDDLERDPDVHFDFEYIQPTSFQSWRGIYKELALGFAIDGEAPKLSKFIEQCKECLGKSFYGYKGGDFIMSKRTPVWVANNGNSGNTAIVDVGFDYWVVLKTATCES